MAGLKVLVVGCGTMGRQIGFLCAWRGHRVIFCDHSGAALESARGFVAATAVEVGADAGSLEVTYTTDLAIAAAGVDIVSESIVEDMRAKRALFRELDRLCPPGTIFTTNTSLLLPSKIGRRSGRPDRFAAIHFYPPVWETRFVDFQPIPSSSAETVARLRDFCASIGQDLVEPRKESVGYVFNALYRVLNHVAITLVVNGVTTIEDVDLSWRRMMKTPYGLFSLMDIVGLDTVLAINRNNLRTFWFYPQLWKNVRWLQSYVDEGRLGVKSGRGFYDYDGGLRRPPDPEGPGAS